MTLFKILDGLVLSLLALVPAVTPTQIPLGSTPTPPLVSLKNGTLAGTHNHNLNQDFFLGIPYAAPPIGDRRLRRPAPPEPWPGMTKTAYAYGPYCIGNDPQVPGIGQNIHPAMSEDCLHLNIIRPGGLPADANLPVLVWIHGGAFKYDSAADPRYNGSFLVRNSVEMGTPMIFASVNYRLGVFGMANGPQVEKAGLDNLLLRDQRQALSWIRENVRAFGGDPSRVTIAGESAGAASVGYHLLAPDEGLFSGAIAQSGGPFPSVSLHSEEERAMHFQILLNVTGCSGAEDALGCLRSVPAESLQKASLVLPYTMTLDGDLLPDAGSRLLKEGRFVEVPLLIGSTRNDGSSTLQFAMPGPLDTHGDFANMVAAVNNNHPLPEETTQKWADLYQQELHDPAAGLGTVLANPGPKFGAEYGLTSLWLGDAFYAAGRRFANQIWADHGLPSYSYFFDVVTANVDAETLGATHYQEIPFMFGNGDSVGWVVDPFPADPGARRRFEDLAGVMSRMWISFVVSGSPNNHRVTDFNVSWPVYSRADPKNFVFSVTEGNHLQADTWRQEALQMFIDMADTMKR
ncbi:carboxylesterase family protein [Colletotrichum plurivorum]|uniref:Carboxylic ester hydrolase n=1 Tax=Colletotrichum plurivorum TaxID=2175906 RepID=A0A8H6N7S0_9PEZI|nr:carboxylesterase family protein [Colletotrichum plurivorum]